MIEGDIVTTDQWFAEGKSAPDNLIIKPMDINLEDPPEIKLDLGCGARAREGFLGVDISADCGADIVHDLLTFPWPWADGTVSEVHCSHFFEHVPARLRPRFMEEMWRVMKVGAKATFITPDADSHRAIQDFTHEWPPVCAESYLYFNKKWMDDNKLSHYGVKCDFDFGYGQSLDPDVGVRNPEFQQFAVKHYRNHSIDLHVTLTRK